MPYEPYSTYQAIITQRRGGATKVIKASCRDHESGMYYLTFEDVADFFDHFAPHGLWKAKIKEHSEENSYCGDDETVRMEIFVDIKKDDPVVKQWLERGNEDSD
tara:strand:+ start:634 stop:945 length:312 start_codon:yes stop_codon:yes gene_type:complete